MKKASYRKYSVAKIEHIWFATSIIEPKADITIMHGMVSDDLNVSGNHKIKPQATLISDLSLSEEELWGGIKKNTKYEIRRAEKEGVKVLVYRSKELPKQLLDGFKKTYEDMYTSKGLNSSFNMELVNSYMAEDMIVFSIAFYKDEPLVFHSYIIDEKHVRFFYSCSPFRDEPEMANIIGRMNRYLHWKDFLYFKEQGITEYDWGGINSIDEPNSIAQFKFAFGGKPVLRYNYILSHGIIGKILLKYKFR